MTIPTDPKIIKQQQKEAARNIERGDWPDEFGLPDDQVPKPRSPVEDLLDVVGKDRVTAKK